MQVEFNPLSAKKKVVKIEAMQMIARGKKRVGKSYN
jgi:hypothetical protein